MPIAEIPRSLYLPIAYIASYLAANALSGDNADFNAEQKERYELAISLLEQYANGLPNGTTTTGKAKYVEMGGQSSRQF